MAKTFGPVYTEFFFVSVSVVVVEVKMASQQGSLNLNSFESDLIVNSKIDRKRNETK